MEGDKGGRWIGKEARLKREGKWKKNWEDSEKRKQGKVERSEQG